jgi:phosphoserine phosphatase
MMLRALRSALTPARLAAPSAFRIAPPLARSATTTSRNYAALATSTSKADALLLKVSGRDSMGITAKFTEMLADAGCQFYDIDQPWCQPWCTNNLSLYFLVSMPDGTTEGSFIRSVLDRSRREDLHIEFEVVSRDDLAAAHADRAPQGLVVTLLSQELGFKEIAAVARTATDTGFNISKIRRLSTLQHEGGAGAAPVPGSTSWCERTGSPAPNITAVEFLVDPAVALTDSKASERRVQLRESLMELRQALQCDVALQRETLLRRSKRLVVLDMDSTIIQQEVIDELARRAGKYDEVSAVTEAAMRGEMDFDESLRQRCEHLKGLPDSVFGTVYRESIDLTPGADRFVQVLQKLGFQVAIISGGFQNIADMVKADLGLDYAFANKLEIREGTLTGRVTGAIVNRERKRDLLESLCQTLGLVSEQVVAVGDGANDLDMLLHAGLGIAFNAKPVVQQQARQAINHTRLDTVLYMMGISDADVENLLSRDSVASSP